MWPMELTFYSHEMSSLNFTKNEDFTKLSQLIRVPTNSGNQGKPGKSLKKVPCMEKSWNLKKTE